MHRTVTETHRQCGKTPGKFRYIRGLTESAMRRIIGLYASLALTPDGQRP
jgi:hypothetical protein